MRLRFARAYSLRAGTSAERVVSVRLTEEERAKLLDLLDATGAANQGNVLRALIDRAHRELRSVEGGWEPPAEPNGSPARRP
jgi:hypothetical protein